MNNLKIDKKGYDFIVSMEGKKNKSYLDSGNVATIGIGFIQVAGHKVTLGMSMTDSQIETEFYKQIKTYEDAVNSLVIPTLNMNQFISLVSFCYNLGIGSLKSSTLLKKININVLDETIASEFNKWCKCNGQVIPGLLRRRNEEAKLFKS